MENKPAIITLGHSDPSGSTGIQADIKTISANGGYAASVITSVVSQNTDTVNMIENVSQQSLVTQIRTAREELPLKVIKIGMLNSKDIIQVIEEVVCKDKTILFDPTLFTFNGAKLIEEDALEDLITKVIPMSTLIVLNIKEVNMILNKEIKSVEEMEVAVKEVQKLGAENVLITGGKLGTEIITDVLLYNDKIIKFETKRVNSKNIIGIKHALASAVATNMGKGYDIDKAVEVSIQYIKEAIEKAIYIRKEEGGVTPINHLFKI